jgi:hypothetical protein
MKPKYFFKIMSQYAKSKIVLVRERIILELMILGRSKKKFEELLDRSCKNESMTNDLKVLGRLCLRNSNKSQALHSYYQLKPDSFLNGVAVNKKMACLIFTSFRVLLIVSIIFLYLT